jgi:hypothetical protein
MRARLGTYYLDETRSQDPSSDLRSRRFAGTIVVLFEVLVVGVSCEPPSSGAPGDASATSVTATTAPAIDGSRSLESPSIEPWSVELVDITRKAGIDFRHENGAYGAKYLPETLGSGVAFLDYDSDGILDLYFVNGDHWPGHAPASAPRPRCELYRGRGDGSFEAVGERTGAAISLYGTGCSVADYDGDGDDDIYVTSLGDNVLLANEGGVFRDRTLAAGVAGGRWLARDGMEHPEWSTGSAWADFDRDGDLDLFVINYVEWTVASDIFTTIDGTTKAFTTPERYVGLPARYYRNRGDGTFEDRSRDAGIASLRGKALGIAIWDFDANGFIDVVVANDTRPNFLFLGHEGGRFTELGLEFGIAYDDTGRARAGMGIDIAEYAHDGVPAVAIGNFSEEPLSLYRWRPGMGFLSAAKDAGLDRATFGPLTFGVLFADIDLDGYDDLLVINGHIEPDIATARQGEHYAQRPQLFRGRAGGFEDVSERSGADFSRALVGRGLAIGDIDRDGDLDVVVTTCGGAPVLWRNDSSGTPPSRSLRVDLRGRGANTRALGARISVRAGGTTRVRLARTGSSYLSQSESTSTFGLGVRDSADQIHVRWPHGEASSVVPGDGQRTIVLEEPDSLSPERSSGD